MTSTTSTPKLSAAFHEAGHAVAAYLHSGELTYVSAVEDATRWGGICTWKAGTLSCSECGPVADAVVALAGQAAENSVSHHRAQRVLERTTARATLIQPCVAETGDVMADGVLCRMRENCDEHGGISSDEQQAQDAIAKIAHSTQEAAALTHWIRLRTTALVESTKFQLLLSHLASVLLERGSIDGQTAAAELARAELQYNNAQALAGLNPTAEWEAA